MRKLFGIFAICGLIGMMQLGNPLEVYADEMDYGYSEEIVDDRWYQDSDGKWRYKEGKHDTRDEMIRDATGKYYYLDRKGIMATNVFVRINDGVGYSNLYYFGEDGARVEREWVQGSDGAWSFAGFSGVIMSRGDCA